MTLDQHIKAGEQELHYAETTPSDNPEGAQYHLQKAQAHFQAASAIAALLQWEASR